MKSRYDVLVIGGGPAGAIAAGTAAKAGLSACMVEKRPAIGAPVRCAEGLGTEALAEFTAPDPCFISAELRGAGIVAPDGSSLQLNTQMAGSKVGYILDRKVFDRELVWRAAETGADVAVKTRASAPILENGAVKGAVLQHCGQTMRVEADVVIAADGVESKFPRWCGIDTTVPVREIMTCAQYLMTDIDIDPTLTVFYVGNEIAPQGYLWIFPKGDRSANVGVGISGLKSGSGHRARDYLDRFVASKFPNGKTIEYIVGGVPVCQPLACTAADGLMIAGDAARVVDPLTGGGIYNAMFTGRLAAQTAVSAISSGKCTKDVLMAYDRGWRESHMGKTIARNWHLKEYFVKMTDEKFNALISSVSTLNLEEISTKNLVRELIRKNPLVLGDLAKLALSLR